jgi:hypothetical protein
MAIAIVQPFLAASWIAAAIIFSAWLKEIGAPYTGGEGLAGVAGFCA